MALLCVVGCKVETDVQLNVNSSGDGTVVVVARLDKAAVQELGGFEKLKTDDLEQVGWTIDPPVDLEGGGLELRASKPFEQAKLQLVMNEVGGVDGVFREWSVGVADGFAETTYQVNGAIRLTGSLDQFSDDELKTALDGLSLGRTPAELSALVAQPTDVALRVEVLAPNSAPFSETFYPAGGESVDKKVAVVAKNADETSIRILIFAGVCILAAGIVTFVGRNRTRRGAR